MRKWTQVPEGPAFTGREELEKAVDKDVQELINLEVFLEVRAEITEIPNDNSRVIITYYITDAFTFVPIPIPLYNSNYGGVQLLYVQIWDNVFGSLINYFHIFSLVLRGDGDDGVETGPFFFFPRISKIKLGNLVLGFGLEQEHLESSRVDSNGMEQSNYQFDRTLLYASSEWRFGPERYFYYSVKPGVEFQYKYIDNIDKGGFDQFPFQFSFEHNIKYDSSNVFYNSRKGYSIGLTNTTRFKQGIENNWVVSTDFLLEAKALLAFGKEGRISYYPRLVFYNVFNGSREKLGIYMRGVTDITMDGKTALFLNQTLGIGLWKWKNVWDLQIHPFFDLGFTLGGTREFNGINDIRRSTGADILLFIEKIPNLVFRYSWGIDLDPSIKPGDKTKTEFIVQYSYTY